MGSILDGQPVNALITNTSKLDRITDDTAYGVITLDNTAVSASGPIVSNLQENVNNGIQDEKLFIRVNNDGLMSWDGTSLTFSDNIVIYSQDYSITNTILASNSPIVTTGTGDSIYVTLSRYATANVTPAVTSLLGKGKDIFRLATRVGTSLVMWDNTLIRSGNSVRIGEGLASPGQIKATFYDPVSTVLPSGFTAIIDGVSIANGDTVLFSNLTSGNNQIYIVSGVGTGIVFTATNPYSGSATPTDGDSVRILKGNGFADQLAVFNGTTFKVNDVVRFFNGTDYWELNSQQTANIANNTTANVFTVAFSGSENIEVKYSVLRGTLKESGTLYITTDGITASVAQVGTVVAITGVTFNASISGSNLLLDYVSDNSGSTGVMKYFIMRWSDAAGGPGGPPSYSGGSSPSGAGGLDTQIQFNQTGLLSGNNALRFNYSTNTLILSSLEITGLATTTLSNNVSSPTTFLSFPTAGYRFLILEYSISRNSTYRIGRLLILHDGSSVSVSDDGNVLPSDPGIVITGIILGANIELQYTSTNTGFNASFKYSARKWL